MKITPKVRTLARSGLVLLAAVTAQHLVAGDPDPAAEALRAFLTTDCEVGDEGQALARLLQYGPAVLPELIGVLVDGPDEATTAELRQTTEEAWERRAAFLSTNPPLGLAPDDLLRVYGADREAWIDLQLAHIVQRLRQRAAIGLAEIGSMQAAHALRQARRGADQDLRRVIDSALTRLQAAGTRTGVRQARPARAPKKPARPQ